MRSSTKAIFRVIRFSENSGNSEELGSMSDLQAALQAADLVHAQRGEFVMIEAAPAPEETGRTPPIRPIRSVS